jgi:hypothetical protein
MKRIILPAALILAIGSASIAQAQSARDVVSPKVTPETSRTTSDAVSGAAKDAMKKDEKASDMKESADMKMKAKDAEDAMKKKMK